MGAPGSATTRSGSSSSDMRRRPTRADDTWETVSATTIWITRPPCITVLHTPTLTFWQGTMIRSSMSNTQVDPAGDPCR